MGVKLLEHVWNAVPGSFFFREMPFFCYEKK
jgi:hypothetical protein